MEFEEIAGIVTRRVRGRFFRHSDVDDFIQEALIRAWTLYSKGKEPGYVITYAQKYPLRFFEEASRSFTGSETRGGSKVGKRCKQMDAAQATRDKIVQYQAEYLQLHGERPSPSQIAVAVGLSDRRVRGHLKALTQGPVRAYDGPVTVFSLSAGSEAQETPEDYSTQTQVESFETPTIRRMDVYKQIRALPEVWQRVLFALYWEDRIQTEIAYAFGLPEAQVPKIRDQALNHLREILETE